MKRFGGWLLILAGLGALGYSTWLMVTDPMMRLWGFALAAGAVSSAVGMQGVRVLDRVSWKKKVIAK